MSQDTNLPPRLMPPEDIIVAAQKVSRYFRENSIEGWQLAGCCDRSFAPGGAQPSVAWRLSLSIDAARTILEMEDVCYGESKGPDTRAVLHAIAAQHPELAEEFGYLYNQAYKV